jgi:ribosomal protein S8
MLKNKKIHDKLSLNIAILNNSILKKKKYAICFYEKTFINVLNILYKEGLIFG